LENPENPQKSMERKPKSLRVGIKICLFMVKFLSKILMLASFAMVLVITGCSKDDKESATGVITGSFAYDGNTYTLTQGAIINYGSYDPLKSNIYYLDLYLMNDGLNLETMSGEGNYLYFEMFSSSDKALLSGTYNYDEPATFTFDLGYVFINHQPGTNTGTTVEVYNGSVTISQSGSDYTITIDCEDENGKKITGSCQGSLKYYADQPWGVDKK
jgi:hypothetical protein